MLPKELFRRWILNSWFLGNIFVNFNIKIHQNKNQFSRHFAETLDLLKMGYPKFNGLNLNDGKYVKIFICSIILLLPPCLTLPRVREESCSLWYSYIRCRIYIDGEGSRPGTIANPFIKLVPELNKTCPKLTLAPPPLEKNRYCWWVPKIFGGRAGWSWSWSTYLKLYSTLQQTTHIIGFKMLLLYYVVNHFRIML